MKEEKQNWGWAVKRTLDMYWEEELSDEETALYNRGRNREERISELSFED